MKFNRLFTKKGLSLERLAALVEVAAAGGIANAAPDNINRQSLICRQLGELERYFRIELKSKSGKSVELTAAGKKLAEKFVIFEAQRLHRSDDSFQYDGDGIA